MKSSIKEQDEFNVITIKNIYLTTERENMWAENHLRPGRLTLTLNPHILELCVTSRHLPS